MSADKVIRSTATVSSCTAASRILGLFRTVLMARLFGTSLAGSAFVIAFMVPNLFRRLFGEGALSAAFVPVYTETYEKEGEQAANRLAGKVMTMLFVSLLCIVLAGVLILTFCISTLPLGEMASMTLPLMRIMLPYMVLICFVALCMAVLNCCQHFFVPAATPVILNLIWILTLIYICPYFGQRPAERVYGVAWGILVAGFIQFLFQVPALLRVRFKADVSFQWNDEKIKRILMLMFPVALGMGVFQFNLIVDRILSTFAGEYGPAALNFAERLIYLPLGVFASALGTVLLPTFSKQAAKDEKDKIMPVLGSALSSLMFVMIPSAVGLCVLAKPIVELFFQYGQFSDVSTRYTARALLFYAPGLVFFSLNKIFVPAFYSIKDVKTPVRVGMWMVLLNLGLNVLFIITWPVGFKHAGIAFATVLSSVVNALVLGILLHRKMGSAGWRNVFDGTMRCLLSAALMGLIVFYMHRYLNHVMAAGNSIGFIARFVPVAGSIAVGVVAYMGIAWLICREEYMRIIHARK